MGEKKTFILAHDAARRGVGSFALTAPEGWHVTFRPPTRSLDQNAAQWPYLEAFSKQLQWPVNGQMVNMTPEEWKDVLTAAFQGETVRLAFGLSGGVVMLGLRTSKMSNGRFSEWLGVIGGGVMILDGDIGNVIRCDRCGLIHDFESGDFDIKHGLWWGEIYKGRHKPRLGDFCRTCAVSITPLVYSLRDIDELTMYVNKLEKAIREKRSQDNRPASHSPGKCRKGGSEWRLGDSEGRGYSQAGEEHF